jgi:hypothetical protein
MPKRRRYAVQSSSVWLRREGVYLAAAYQDFTRCARLDGELASVSATRGSCSSQRASRVRQAARLPYALGYLQRSRRQFTPARFDCAPLLPNSFQTYVAHNYWRILPPHRRSPSRRAAPGVLHATLVAPSTLRVATPVLQVRPTRSRAAAVSTGPRSSDSAGISRYRSERFCRPARTTSRPEAVELYPSLASERCTRTAQRSMECSTLRSRSGLMPHVRRSGATGSLSRRSPAFACVSPYRVGPPPPPPPPLPVPPPTPNVRCPSPRCYVPTRPLGCSLLAPRRTWVADHAVVLPQEVVGC